MFDTSSSGSRPLRHDAETFRVAEELIMLSSRAASASSMDRKPNDSPSNISGFFEHTAKTEKRVPKVKAKKGRSQSHHPSIPLVKQAKTNASSSRGAAHKSSDRDGVKQELDPVASAQEIINSRCDLSHSELLKEHRVRFRRVRRRWNIEQRNKKQEYLARFHVQGIPLVQHLEALTHWRALYRAGLRGTTRRGAHHETQRQQAQAKDKTALKIAANEALFGQTGGSADEPWALGLSSTSSTSGGGSGSGGLWGSADATWFGASPAQTVTATENVFTRSGNHNPARSGRSVGNSVRKATGGGDSLPLASADAPSMGNYDRDAHLRMPMAQRITGHPQVSQVAATSTISHHLPHRMKNAPPTNTTGNSNNSSSTVPYFHHFLDRSNNSSSSSSTNSLPFNQTSSFADSVPVSTGKRPRPSSSNSFLTPLGFLSPLFETDHPLPDFSTNWGFNSRNVSRSSSSTSNAPMSTSATMTTTSHSISNVTTTSNLAGIGSGFSSPNGASMFAGVDSFLPDYDSTLYSLWNAPGGGSVMGYETENDAAQGQQQQVQPPLYMTSDDELKMDYPQLPEFNQDLDSYLNDAMDSGASPTTPLGTSNSVMKMDHLVTTDRRTGAGVALSGANLTTLSTREPVLERLLAPAAATATAEFLVKRDRGLIGLDSTSARTTKRLRGAFDDAYAAAPVSSAALAGSTPSSSATSFRSLSKNPTIEPKRAVMPSLGSYHSGQSLLILTPTSTTSATLVVSTAPPPKSVQCRQQKGREAEATPSKRAREYMPATNPLRPESTARTGCIYSRSCKAELAVKEDGTTLSMCEEHKTYQAAKLRERRAKMPSRQFDPLQCQYPGGCKKERLIKLNGDHHWLCENHRERQNASARARYRRSTSKKKAEKQYLMRVTK
ncbi:hypothetical protein PC117_g14241 [Phytophthora cactorum]|uniref:Uncharacterized protein n=2 Tax=Phytophthora cactorum TaxID=29920 RepID=A0A8T1CXW0_9STRA|nr:hypothetical protein PC117_g14241 [Phytophthora cactorum]